MVFPKTVFAENMTCDYGDGLKIFYNNGNVDYDYKGLADQWYHHTSILTHSGTEMYTESEVKIDQEELKKALNEYFCPETVYLCEKTEWGVELPSLNNLLNSFGATMDSLVHIASLGYIDMTNYFNQHVENSYSLFQFDNKELHIMGQEKYNNDWSDKLGGSFASSFTDGAESANDSWICSLGDGIPFVEGGVDLVCSVVGGAGNLIWDLVASDNELLLGYRDISCYKYSYPEDGEYSKINIDCRLADMNIKLLDQYIIDYNKCSSDDINCLMTNKIIIDDKLEVVRKQCDSILKNFDYVDSERHCIDKCLQVGDKIDQISEMTTGQNNCGFSQKLVLFIANIVKWGKYLVPVIVMIFGILDFIKALSSDKDDAMKKAQSNFIKRLIICAIIFIIPFIVEFILEKMGFAANGCGIIDL